MSIDWFRRVMRRFTWKHRPDVGSFDRMVQDQKEFNARFVPKNLTLEQKEQWTMTYISCLHNELEELRNELRWKHWKDYTGVTPDEIKIKGEIIDSFIFVLALCNVWDMDANEIIGTAIAKQIINDMRQESGY